MLYGSPAWDIAGDSTDRIGIRTLTISKFWQPKTWSPTMVDPQLAPEFPAPPPVSGGVLLIDQKTMRKGGGFKTFWTFEGVNGDGRSVTFKTKSNSLDYQFDPGFSQVDIKLLPAFQDLMAQYGGFTDGGDVIWPATIPATAAAASGSGFNPGASAAGSNNPMFGQQDYLRLEGTYSFRYAAFDPTASQAGVATIFQGGLPGNAPSFSDGRNWLKAPAPFKRRGPVYDITEIYWLSGPGGWPTPVYSGGSGAGGGSGDFSINAASNFGFNNSGAPGDTGTGFGG